jgi:hypothetical protein
VLRYAVRAATVQVDLGYFNDDGSDLATLVSGVKIARDIAAKVRHSHCGTGQGHKDCAAAAPTETHDALPCTVDPFFNQLQCDAVLVD